MLPTFWRFFSPRGSIGASELFPISRTSAKLRPWIWINDCRERQVKLCLRMWAFIWHRKKCNITTGCSLLDKCSCVRKAKIVATHFERLLLSLHKSWRTFENIKTHITPQRIPVVKGRFSRYYLCKQVLVLYRSSRSNSNIRNQVGLRTFLVANNMSWHLSEVEVRDKWDINWIAKLRVIS